MHLKDTNLFTVYITVRVTTHRATFKSIITLNTVQTRNIKTVESLNNEVCIYIYVTKSDLFEYIQY